MGKVAAIVFDLDGVLADLVEVHYVALNKALAKHGFPIITREQQDSVFNGLPTKTKMNLLGVTDPDMVKKVYDTKQEYTMEAIGEVLGPDLRLQSVLMGLKDLGYRLVVASNAIRQTIAYALERLGITEFFEFCLSNQDVSNPKPHPEIYLKAMQQLGLTCESVLIVEDSPHGQRAALESGGILCAVKNPAAVTLERILNRIYEYESGHN